MSYLLIPAVSTMLLEVLKQNTNIQQQKQIHTDPYKDWD